MKLFSSKVLSATSLAFACLAWGFTPVATRYLVLRLPPSEILEVRFALAGLLSVPLLVRARLSTWRRKDLAMATVLSILGLFGYQVAIVQALRFATASNVGIVLGIEPILIVALNGLRTWKPPSRSVVLSALGGGVGVVIVSGVGRPSGRLVIEGLIYAIAAATLWSGYVVWTTKYMQRYSAYSLSSLSLVVGSLSIAGVSLPSAIAHFHRPTVSEALLLLALGPGATVITFLVWNFGISRVGSTEAGVFLYLVPVASVFGGVVFLSERLALHEIIGGIIVLTSLSIAQGVRIPQRTRSEAMLR